MRSLPLPLPNERGAALAFSLMMLVIVVLLGIAAVRATQIELRLSLNAESRLSAQQNAESVNAYVLTTAANIPTNDDATYLACYPLKAAAAVMSDRDKSDCSASSNAVTLAKAPAPITTYGYAVVRRESPLFAETTVLREAEVSSGNYDFARYTLIGGYDRSRDNFGAAEVTEGQLILHVKPAGLTYQ